MVKVVAVRCVGVSCFSGYGSVVAFDVRSGGVWGGGGKIERGDGVIFHLLRSRERGKHLGGNLRNSRQRCGNYIHHSANVPLRIRALYHSKKRPVNVLASMYIKVTWTVHTAPSPQQ